MPAVFIGKKEWFPIEFLTQAFGKAKDANSTDHVRSILGYYDENAGTRCVDNVTRLMQRLCTNQNQLGVDIFQQFSMSRVDQPVQLRAKVLALPRISFHGSHSSI